MTRQNRVMPDATILADPARGTLTGNRGILHDVSGNLGAARWRHAHWIACELDYKDWRRQIMAPRRWTELFFLDEAVALTAGHRPCALCRRADYTAFRAAWTRAFGAEASASQIDRILHAARRQPGSQAQMTHEQDIATLPGGTFIRLKGAMSLLRGDHLLPFTPTGYAAPASRPTAGQVTVLTPRPMVSLLTAGYLPRLHPTAG